MVGANHKLLPISVSSQSSDVTSHAATPSCSAADTLPTSCCYFGSHGERDRQGIVGERGIALVLFAMLVVVAFGIAALVVDHSKEEIAVYHLQRAADAAALAGARSLNGEIGGWWEAKKSAVAVLKQNPIHGIPDGSLGRISLTSGRESYWDNPQNGGVSAAASESQLPGATPPVVNTGYQGSHGRISVKVERGVYWQNDGATMKFTSLETDEDGKRQSSNLFLIANAVRVTVSLSEIDTIFGRTLGVAMFNNLTRVSIAVMDQAVEFEAAPMAVPLCSLLENQDPHVIDGDHTNDHLDVGRLCQREAYVTELGARGDLRTDLDSFNPSPLPGIVTRDERDDGLTRFEAAVERPMEVFNGRANLCLSDPTYRGAAKNCKSSSINLTFGVASQTRPNVDNPATEEEVLQYLETPQRIRAGYYFRPRMTLNGLHTPAARARIARAINNGGRTIRGTFMTGNIPKRNFPFDITARPTHIPDPQLPWRLPIGGSAEQIVNYDRIEAIPGDIGGVGARVDSDLYHHDASANPWESANFRLRPNVASRTAPQFLRYSNPLGHDDAIRYNDLDRGPVRPVRVMVIAPGLEEYHGDVVDYCNPKVKYNPGPDAGLEPMAPHLSTSPIVVGSVPAYLFDFNTQVLRQRTTPVPIPGYFHDSPGDHNVPEQVTQTSLTPVYINNGDGVLFDGDPSMIKGLLADASTRLKEYENSVDSYIECRHNDDEDYDPDTGTGGGDDDDDDGDRRAPSTGRRGHGHGHSVPDDCRRIEPPPFEADEFTVPPNWRIYSCFDFRRYDELIEALDAAAEGNRFGHSLSLLSQLDGLLQDGILAWPHAHCVPRLRRWGLNPNVAANYKPLGPLLPGVGVGGGRLRFECGGEIVSAVTGKGWRQNQPTLVSSTQF